MKTLCMICGYELPIKNGGLHVQHSQEDCNANLKYKLQEARKRITELEQQLKAEGEDRNPNIPIVGSDTTGPTGPTGYIEY